MHPEAVPVYPVGQGLIVVVQGLVGRIDHHVRAGIQQPAGHLEGESSQAAHTLGEYLAVDCYHAFTISR